MWAESVKQESEIMCAHICLIDKTQPFNSMKTYNVYYVICSVNKHLFKMMKK